MNTSIIGIIIVVFLLLTFTCHALFRIMKKTEATLKEEVTKNAAVMAATQELLRFTSYLPYQSNVFTKLFE